MELKLNIDGECVLEVCADGEVLVPMDEKERAQCREALQDALRLLAETVVTRSTFSTAVETDEAWIQTSQHHPDCLAVFCCFPPSKPPEDTRGPLRRPVWYPMIVAGIEPRGS